MINKISNQILLVSSNTIDNIFGDNGRLIRQQPGGPAKYCLSALKIEKVPFFLLTQENIQVEIIVTKDGEQVKVFNCKARTIPSQYLVYEHILISPVSNEWSLKNLDYSKNIYVDIQGYVRKQGEYNAKKIFLPPKRFEPFCIKSSESEIEYLPKTLIDHQIKRCLIITKGEKGAQIYYQSKLFKIKPPEIVCSQDTIGAGDTFFAHFIAHLALTKNPKKSGEHAARKVIEFLKRK